MERHHARTLVAVAAIAVLSLVSCTVHQSAQPSLAGPSTFATSLSISANPDLITLGSSATSFGGSSIIIVKAFDANGNPKPNQTITLDTSPHGCGQLQSTALTTGANGQASTLFTAPGSPLPLPECANFSGGVIIGAALVGTDASVSRVDSVATTVEMVQPVVVTPTNGMTVNFTIAPNPAPVNSQVFFSDAGSSSPGHTITSYRWTFSDGVTKFGANVSHDFNSVGTFTATLTITDDIGQSAFKTAFVTIQ